MAEEREGGIHAQKALVVVVSSATLTGINYTKTMTETKIEIFMAIKGKQFFYIPNVFFVRGKKL